MSNTDDPIRVLIVDDHGVLRDSLQDLLNEQEGMQSVGTAGTGEECLVLAKKLKPDIVLMDIKMPGMSGLDATRLLKADLPDVKVLIMSTYDDELNVLNAFRTGADGYIPKELPAAKVVEAIRELHEKGTLIPQNILPKLLQGVKRLGDAAAPGPHITDLTAGEIKVLSMVKKGLQNKHIARELDVSEKTVRNHLSKVFAKLGAKSRSDAIVTAIYRGILGLD